MISNEAKSNYNMTFNNGHFEKGKNYKYRYDEEKEKVFVTTEENTEQDFYFSEFDTLFSFLRK